MVKFRRALACIAFSSGLLFSCAESNDSSVKNEGPQHAEPELFAVGILDLSIELTRLLFRQSKQELDKEETTLVIRQICDTVNRIVDKKADLIRYEKSFLTNAGLESSIDILGAAYLPGIDHCEMKKSFSAKSLDALEEHQASSGNLRIIREAELETYTHLSLVEKSQEENKLQEALDAFALAVESKKKTCILFEQQNTFELNLLSRLSMQDEAFYILSVKRVHRPYVCKPEFDIELKRPK